MSRIRHVDHPCGGQILPWPAGKVTEINSPQRAPGLKKIQSREAILKKSSFQYGMKFSIENGFFIPGPSLAAEKQGLGLKFSIENENFKPRMKISSENENFVRGGMVFSCVRARMNFFDPGPSGSRNKTADNNFDSNGTFCYGKGGQNSNESRRC